MSETSRLTDTMSPSTITIQQLAFTGFAVFATASFCTSATIEGFFFTFFIASLLFPGVYFIAKSDHEPPASSTLPSPVNHDTEHDPSTDGVAHEVPRDNLVENAPRQQDQEQRRHDRAPNQHVRFVEHFGASDRRERHNPSTRHDTRSTTESHYSQASPERLERQNLPDLQQQDHTDLQQQLDHERRTVETLEQVLAARVEELAARDREIVRLHIQLVAERGRNAPVIPIPPPAQNGAYGRAARAVNEPPIRLVSALELNGAAATGQQNISEAQMSTSGAHEGASHRAPQTAREDGALQSSWGRFSNISILPGGRENDPRAHALEDRTQHRETQLQNGHNYTLASARPNIVERVLALRRQAPQRDGRPGWFDASAPAQTGCSENQRDANIGAEQQAALENRQQKPACLRAAARQEAERRFREALENIRPREGPHGQQARGLPRLPQDGCFLPDARPVVGPSLPANPTTLAAPSPTSAAPSVTPQYPPRPPRAPQPNVNPVQPERPMVMNQCRDSRVQIPALQPVDVTSVFFNDSPVPPPYLSRLQPLPADVAPRAPASMPSPAGRGLAPDAAHGSSSCDAYGAGPGPRFGPISARRPPPGFVPTSFEPFSDGVDGTSNDVADAGTEHGGGGMQSRTGASVATPSAINIGPDPSPIPSVGGITQPTPVRRDHDAPFDLVSPDAAAGTMHQSEHSVARCARGVGEGTFGRADTARGANALQGSSAHRYGGEFSPFWLTVEWAQNRTISVRFDSSIVGPKGPSTFYVHDEAALDGAASTVFDLLGGAWDPYPGEDDKRPALFVRANIQSLAPVDAFLRILVARTVFSLRLWKKIRIQMPEVTMERAELGRSDTPTNLGTLAFPSTTIIYSGAPENVPYPWSSIIGLSRYQVRKLDIRCAVTQEECMAIAGSNAEYMNERVMWWVPLRLRLVRIIPGRQSAGRRATFFSRLQTLHVVQFDPVLTAFRDQLLEEGRRCIRNHAECLVD